MEEMRKIRFRGIKFTFWIGTVVFLFVTSLVILLLFDIKNSSKMFKTKSKRFVNLSEPDFLKNVQMLKQVSGGLTTSDIRLIPEMESRNRKIDQHPNHRYAEMESSDKIYSKMLRDLYFKSGWSPYRFERKQPFTNITDVISKENPEIKVSEFRDEELKGFGKMRLKGVYLHPDEEDSAEDGVNEFSDNYYYLKEINELMQNNFNGSEDEGKLSLKKAFKGQGSAFQPPIKAFEALNRYQTNQAKNRNYWTKPGSRTNEKKPLTILLEVYPMTDIQNHPGRFWPPRKLPNGKLYYPKPPKMFEPSDGSFDGNERNRFLMKLNLYPKKKKQVTSVDIKKVYPRNDKRAERRTYRVYTIQKKSEPKKVFRRKISYYQ